MLFRLHHLFFLWHREAYTPFDASDLPPLGRRPTKSNASPVAPLLPPDGCHGVRRVPSGERASPHAGGLRPVRDLDRSVPSADRIESGRPPLQRGLPRNPQGIGVQKAAL